MKPPASAKRVVLGPRFLGKGHLGSFTPHCGLLLSAALAAVVVSGSYSVVHFLSRTSSKSNVGNRKEEPQFVNAQGIAALQHINSMFPKEVANMVRRKAAEEDLAYPQNAEEQDQAAIALARILRRREMVHSFPMEDPIPKEVSASLISNADGHDFLSKAAAQGEDPEMLKGLAKLLEPDPNDPNREARREKRIQRQQHRVQELLTQHNAAEGSDNVQGGIKSLAESGDGAISKGLEQHNLTEAHGAGKASFVMFKEGQHQMVRLIKDQLIMAKAYSTIAVQGGTSHLAKELKTRIKELTKVLGEAEADTDLPRNTIDKMRGMGQTLSKAKEQLYDCTSLVKKLRSMVHATDDQNQALRKQSLFLSQLAARTVPKGLFCLSMRLTVEYSAMSPAKRQLPGKERLQDKSLYHYALFSDNVLASAVVVNSTITNCKDSSKHVIHIVTDRLNFGAMTAWFALHPPGNAAIEVLNIDDFTWLNSSYCPVLRQLETATMKEYYFRMGKGASSGDSAASNLKYRNPKYLSMLNHLRFYLPEVFPYLDKILFLDDDIVVQRDLTGLWKEDLKGMVNGAVETCGASFHRFDKYLNFSNPLISSKFDPQACGWAYGMNMFDLIQWKEKNITGIYHYWQNLNEERALWKLGTLPPGLITFYNLTHPLSKHWHFLGLGYNPNLDMQELERAAVVHYNGNMKPWLEIGMSKFRLYWQRYVDYGSTFLQLCNINP